MIWKVFVTRRLAVEVWVALDKTEMLASDLWVACTRAETSAVWVTVKVLDATRLDRDTVVPFLTVATRTAEG